MYSQNFLVGQARRPSGPVYRPQGNTGIVPPSMQSAGSTAPAPRWGFTNPFAGVNGGFREHPIESSIVVGANALPGGPIISRVLRWWFNHHNQNQQNNNPGWDPGSPGSGYSNGQFGNYYGGFGNDYGLTGAGYGSTSGSSYGSGQGFGNGLGTLVTGPNQGNTNQFGLPTGPVHFGTPPGNGGGSNGLGQLGQAPGGNFGSNPLIGMGFVDTPTRDDWNARALPRNQ